MTLNKEQKEILNDLTKVIQTEADIIKLDYENNPSDMDSGSAVVVHQDSPLLKDESTELGDIAFYIQPSSNINDYGDDDWAAPQQQEEE